MFAAVRAGCLVVLCASFCSMETLVSAADLAGTWRLNFPDDPTTWTFTQDGSSFTATTGDLSGEQYDIVGITFGPWFAGILFYTIGDSAAPTVPIGALAGAVNGDSMSGFLASYLLGIVEIDGERQSQPAARNRSRAAGRS